MAIDLIDTDLCDRMQNESIGFWKTSFPSQDYWTYDLDYLK